MGAVVSGQVSSVVGDVAGAVEGSGDISASQINPKYNKGVKVPNKAEVKKIKDLTKKFGKNMKNKMSDTKYKEGGNIKSFSEFSKK